MPMRYGGQAHLSHSLALSAASRPRAWGEFPFCQLRGRVEALQPDCEMGRGGAQFCSCIGRGDREDCTREPGGQLLESPSPTSNDTREGRGGQHHKGLLCAQHWAQALGWP